MKRETIDSSNINSIGYNKESKTLEVQFKNEKVYQYKSISAETHEDLMGCHSKGRYLFDNIKGKYDCEQVLDED